MTITTSKDAKIRLLDGTATPFYLELDHDMADFNAPLGGPMTDEILILDRGRASADMHNIQGDHYKLLEPFDITFSVKVRDDAQYGYLEDWIDVLNKSASTTVNSNTIVTTKGTTQRDGSNNNPAFADPNKAACDVVYFINTSGTDRGRIYREVWFPIQDAGYAEGDSENTVALVGKCYGTVDRITSWPSGNSVE